MKNRCCLLVAGILLSTTPVLAGIRYEFKEASRTEETGKSTSLAARAVVEGPMSRLDVLSGNRYAPGSYVISHGDDHVFVVNPEEKTYIEYNTAQRSVDPSQVKLTNPTVKFEEVVDEMPEVIAGFPTKHYRLRMGYDITVQMGKIAIKQRVNTVIDKWTTTAFDHLIEQYKQNYEDVKTGNPQIDALIETEATKFEGLALKQRIHTETIAEQSSRNPNVNLPATRKRTREMIVSQIEEVQVSPNYFAIPIDFVKSDASEAPPAATQYLTMQPDKP